MSATDWQEGRWHYRRSLASRVAVLTTMVLGVAITILAATGRGHGRATQGGEGEGSTDGDGDAAGTADGKADNGHEIAP